MIELMLILLMSMILNMNKYLLSNLMFMFIILFMMNMNFFLNWNIINFDLNLNLYSLGLLMLTIWIFSIIKLIKELKIIDLLFIITLLNFFTISLLKFYIFFEISLILMFILIFKWGMSYLRIQASYYFMFYTFFFSFPMMLTIFNILNMNFSDNFIIMELNNYKIDFLMMMILIMGFLVKFPLFLIHNWLLKAHVEAPVYGSMMLAAIMLKLGSYGLIRIMLIFYKFFYFNMFFIELSLIGSIIMSFMCFRQIDLKMIIAMSSVVHMNMMLSSVLTLLKISVIGSYIMMISHGLCSSGLFYILNINYEMTNSRMLIFNKGIMIFCPILSMMWFLLCSSNMSAPMSLNLVSEIMLLLGLFSWNYFFMMKMFLYCLMSFMYSLYLFSYINHGEKKIHIKLNSKMFSYLIILIHWIPLNLIILNLKIFM